MTPNPAQGRPQMPRPLLTQSVTESGSTDSLKTDGIKLPDVPAWRRALEIAARHDTSTQTYVRDLGSYFYAEYVHPFCRQYRKKFQAHEWIQFREPIPGDPVSYVKDREIMHAVLYFPVHLYGGSLFKHYVPSYSFEEDPYRYTHLRQLIKDAWYAATDRWAKPFKFTFRDRRYVATPDLMGCGPFITPIPDSEVEGSVYALADILAGLPVLWSFADA